MITKYKMVVPQISTWSASNIGLFCKKKSRHLPGSHTHSPLLQTELRTYKFGQNLGNLDNCTKSITMDNILQLRALDNDRCGIMFNIWPEDIHCIYIHVYNVYYTLEHCYHWHQVASASWLDQCSLSFTNFSFFINKSVAVIESPKLYSLQQTLQNTVLSVYS